MSQKDSFARSPIKLVILYIVITFFIVALGIRYYYRQKEDAKRDAYSDLSVIAELKAKQISNWRDERIGDAEIVFYNKVFISDIRNWFEKSNENEFSNTILPNLLAYQNIFHYKNIIILDTNGVIKYSLDSQLKNIEKSANEFYRNCQKERKPIISELYFCESCNDIHLDIIIPLFELNKFVGGLIFRVDPNEFLFPLIQSWPTISKSSETLLIKKDSSEVVFLNELRHKENTALKYKLKIDSSNYNVPAVMAALGKTGQVGGIDYRGIKVFADIREINDANWFIITKVDIDEIFKPVYEKAIYIFTLAGLVLITFGIGFIWVWSNQKKSIKIIQLEDNNKQQALLKHFEYLVKYANDIFLLTDKHLNIVEVNKRALEVYGYPRDELIGMNISKLRHPDAVKNLKEKVESLSNSSEAIYETLHINKEGLEIPVEISLRNVEINDTNYYQAILRDISERKKAEEVIRNSEIQYRSLFENMNEGFALCEMIYEDNIPKDFKYLKVNKKFEEQTGLKDVEGKLVTEIIPEIRTKDDKLLEIYGRVSKTGISEKLEYYVESLNDWYDISVYSTRRGYFVVVFDVITERKNIEKALKESEIKFRGLFENAVLGIYRTTPDGKIIDCNPALLKLLGFDSFEKLSERNLENYGYDPGYSRDYFKKQIQEYGEVIGLESSWIKKDGTSIIVRENSKAIRDSNEKIVFYEGTIEDITARRKAEDDLKYSEYKFRRLHESLIDGFVLVDMNGNIIDCNDTYCTMLGYTTEEIKSKTYVDLTPERWHDFETEIVKNQIYENGFSDVYEKEYIRKNGEVFPVELRAFIIKNEKGEKEGIWAIVRDITSRKKSEQDIRLSEEKFSKIFRSSPYAIVLSKPVSGEIIDANAGFTNLIGYKSYELIGKSTLDLNIWSDLNDREYVVSELKKGNSIHNMEFGFIKKSGEPGIGMYSAELIVVNNENLILSSFADITNLKNAESRIKNLSERYNMILANQYMGLLVTSEDGNVDFVNEKFCEIFDLPLKAGDLIGLTSEEMISKIIPYYNNPQETTNIIRIFVEKNTPSFDNEVKLINGKTLQVDYIPLTIDGKKSGRIWQHRDISDRKKIEHELKKSYELLDEMGKIAKIGGWEFDPITFKGKWTEQVALIHDLDQSEETNAKIGMSFYVGESKIKIQNAIKEITEKGTPYDLELELMTAKGNHKWVRTIGLAEKEGDKIVKIKGSFQDITLVKKVEAALEESEDKFRSLFKSMNEGVALHELIFNEKGEAIDYRIIDVNPAYKTHTGIKNSDAKNQIASKFYKTNPPPYLDEYVNVAETGIPYFFDTYYPPLEKHFEISVFSPKKNLFATVFTDITERKIKEKELLENERKLREAQEMAHLGYWNWNIKSGDVEWSDEVYKIFRLDPIKFKPHIDSILSLSPWPEENQRDKELINKAINSREPGFYEQKFLRPDDSIGYYSSTFHGNYNEKDELVSIVGTIMDITERKKNETAINELNEELEQKVIERTSQLEASNKELEAFSYSVSHDLRAPLRSIDGFSLALMEDYYEKLDNSAKDYIDRIRNATSRMDSLIDSMLMLSRVTRFELKNEQIDLSEIINGILNNYKSGSPERNANFIIQKNVIVNADSYLVSIALENLLSNAWKYSSKNEKTVIEFGTILQNSKIIYFIKDNGVGFDMKYYNKLFGAFQRLHSKKEYPGTGIGLATAQRIIHRHSGEIWAESEESKGTIFYFTLK